MGRKTTTLPARDEMLCRLVGVHDNAHFQEHFYPILLNKAGHELFPEGVGIMILLAIHDYTVGMPLAATPMMYGLAPQYIDALVNDKELATRAKRFLKKALSSPP